MEAWAIKDLHYLWYLEIILISKEFSIVTCSVNC